MLVIHQLPCRLECAPGLPSIVGLVFPVGVVIESKPNLEASLLVGIVSGTVPQGLLVFCNIKHPIIASPHSKCGTVVEEELLVVLEISSRESSPPGCDIPMAGA